jgi:hypothetical protein
MKTIYEKLNEARKLIRNRGMQKEGTNAFSKYDYFTPEQVETLVYEACEQVKAICVTSLKIDERGYYQELEFVDLEPTAGEKPQSIRFELRTEKPDIKATNVTQQMGGMDTYSERYIKMKAFQIKDNTLDFDAQDNRAEAPKAKAYSTGALAAKLHAATTLEQLRATWESFSTDEKNSVYNLKESLKTKLAAHKSN